MLFLDIVVTKMKYLDLNCFYKRRWLLLLKFVLFEGKDETLGKCCIPSKLVTAKCSAIKSLFVL